MKTSTTFVATTLVAAVGAVLAGSAGLQAQSPTPGDSAGSDTVRQDRTAHAPGDAARAEGDSSSLRATLRRRIDSLEARRQAASDAGKRERLNRQIDAVRQRLETGDFESGQIVKLEVSRMPRWSGEFTLDPGPTLRLPGIDPISFEGVLYPEAPVRVKEALSAYIRDPEVKVEPLRRIGVLGAVTNPGFYQLSGEVTVSEAIMTAGGLTQEAEMDDFSVETGGKPLAAGSPDALQERTLDELGLRSGDALKVPADGGGVRSWLVAAGSLGSVLGVALAVF